MKRFDYRALGRLRAGQMNRTETAYASYLEGLRRAGQVLWYRFEGLKLRLADKTFFTADFAVLGVERVVELHEVKGAMAIFQDDSKAKIKIAAEQYPFVFKLVLPGKGGIWEVREI